jgi:hypothetical protein
MRLTVDAAARMVPAPGAASQASDGHPAGDADLQLVTVMPLHAVTAMYGEQGLRARFAAEITRFQDTAGQERCLAAGEGTSETRRLAREEQQRGLRLLRLDEVAAPAGRPPVASPPAVSRCCYGRAGGQR